VQFRHVTLIDDEALSSAGTNTWDLPINPMSHLIITIKALNNGTNTKATLANLLAALTNIEVLRFGSAIVSISAADLYALNCVLLGKEPWQENVINTDNAVRHLSLILPFGRKLYNPDECLPATIRGELSLRITNVASGTGWDGLILQVDTIELLDANPRQHLKYTTLTATPSATGAYDIELPIGLRYVGLLLYSTTIPDGTSWTTTIDKVTLLANDSAKYYRQVNWESLHGELINKLSPANAWAEKFHMENTASSYTQNADTATEEQDDTDIAHYSYMDFDPAGNDEFLFDSSGLSSLVLRVQAGDTNAIRVIPVQLMTPS